MKGSFFGRIFVRAWNVICIHPPAAAPRADDRLPEPEYVFRLVPWLGALAALAALLAAKLLGALFVPRAATLLFASAALFASEWRTSGRGLALLVSTLDGLFSGKSPAEARAARTAHFRTLTGLAPLLMVLLIAGGKCAAFVLAFRDGCPWFVGTAWTAAFTAESCLKSDGGASANRMAGGAAHTRPFILASGGFLLLWSFVFRALPTLTGTALAVAAVWLAVPAVRIRNGRAEAGDAALAGYLAELMMLLALLIFL